MFISYLGIITLNLECHYYIDEIHNFYDNYSYINFE